MSNPTIKIVEVECYRGNAWNISKYATHASTQHQIIFVQDNKEYFLGYRNKVADSDRMERIVFEKETSFEALDLLKKCIDLQAGLMSENCRSMEECNVASEYNAPIHNQIKLILSDLYKIESLDVEERVFITHILA